MLERLLEIGRRTFGVIRDQPVLFVPSLAEAAVGLIVGSGFVGAGMVASPFAVRQLGVMALLASLAFAVLSILVQAGRLYWFHLAQRGHEVTWEDFVDGTQRFFWRILGASVVGGLAAAIISGLLMVVFGPFLFRGGPNFLAFLLFLPMGIAISVFVAFWDVSIVRNDTGVFDGLYDSFNLARRFFSSILLVSIVRGLFGGGGFSSNFNYETSGNVASPVQFPAVFSGGVLGTIAGAFVSTFFGVYMFEFYEDLRSV